jgi:hypothetical protein
MSTRKDSGSGCSGQNVFVLFIHFCGLLFIDLCYLCAGNAKTALNSS